MSGKADPKPAGSGPKSPVTPLGGKKLGMERMRGVLENATHPS